MNCSRGFLPGIAAASVTALLLTSADSAVAQRWNVETGVGVTGTVSSNPELAPSGQERADVLLEISPRFSLIGTGQGGRLRVSGSGDLGATLNARLRGENRFSLRPQGGLNATLEAVENFFFIDAGFNVQRSLESPFLATSDRASPINTFTSYQARLSPYIQGRLAGTFDYVVRSDNSWTDSGQTVRQYSGRHSARIERAPQPIGAVLSAERTELKNDREGEPTLTTDLARMIVRYAPVSQYVFGVRGGWERNNYGLSNDSRTFYGADIGWRPNERTSLNAFWEDRFFGSSWQLGFSHRRPRLAFSIQSSRSTSTTPEQFVTFPGLANLVALLDAAFTTRIPDPIERQRAVIEFLSRQQLPSELLTPLVIYDERISLLTSTSASVVLIGQRNSLAFSVFASRSEGIAGTRSLLPPGLENNSQRGTEVTYTRQTSPVTSLSATASWRVTEGLGDQSNQQTTQTLARLQANTQLGHRTNGYVAARLQWIDSNVTNDAREVALLFGLDHRF